MHQTSNDIKAHILFTSDAFSPSCSFLELFFVFLHTHYLSADAV